MHLIFSEKKKPLYNGDCITSVLRYCGPIPASGFSAAFLAVGPMNCMSDTHSNEKKGNVFRPTVGRCTLNCRLDALHL